jgi:hypothetical protein
MPMNDEVEIDEEVEEFIRDWYSNDASHKYAQALCRFLFKFTDSLQSQGLSEATIKKHTDNCWCIGTLECSYGYRDAKFDPEDVFESSEAQYEYEFRRKMSDSKYAINSYRTTWRKIHKYKKNLSSSAGA